MMKKVITRMLAFAAVLLCGGAWAAAPVAIWTNFTGADADAGITKGDYILKANGNSVATDGSSIKIDQNVGVKIDRSTTLANTAGMTVVYKFRNLVVGGTDKTLATSSTNTSGNDQSGVKITTVGQTSGMWGTGDYNTSATQTTIGSVNSGSIAFVYGPKVTGNTGTYLYLKNDTGAYTSIYSCGGLKGQDDTPAGMAIGGRRAANNSFPAATGMVIESVAVFDNALTAAELATFSLEKEMLYYFGMDDNTNNGGMAGSLKVGKNGDTITYNNSYKWGSKSVQSNGAAPKVSDSNGIASKYTGWTISFWFNPNSMGTWQDVCGFKIGTATFKFERTQADALHVYNDGNFGTFTDTGNNGGMPYTGSAWNHVVVALGADGKSLDYYMNGIYRVSLSPSAWATTGAPNLTEVIMGANGLNENRTSSALTDEYAIYNFSMTPSQVAMLSTQKPSAEACLDGRELASSLFANGEIDNTNPHLLIHLDASNEDSFEFEEEKVSKWKDLSSYARHATPAQAKANDTMVTNKATRETENGRAIVNMGATGSGIDLGYTRMTTIRTVFQVMSIEQNANAFFLGDHGNQVYPFHRGGSGQYAMNNAVFGNNRDSNVWCDGVAKRPTLDTPPTDCHIYTIELGADGTSNRLSQDREINNRNGGRKISEMLVFDRVLTPSERVLVESYLAKKWNISPVVPPQLSRKVIAANFGADYTTIPATVDTQFPLVSLPGSAWTQTRTASNTSGISIDVIDPMTLEATGASATMKWASSNTYRENGGVEKSSALSNGYLDDGQHTWWGTGNVTGAMIGFENIPFSSYDVVVIGATDGGSRTFRAVAVTAGDAAVQKYTFADGVTKVGDSDWGESYYRVPEEGKNALVIKGLTGATLTIQGGSNADSSRGGIAAVMIVDAGEKVWTNGTGDGNWNTAGNWAMGRVPTAEDDVTIDVPATISVTSASVAKSLKIAADVTITGAFAGGSIKKVTFEEGATLTADVANGSESKLQNVIGGKIIKTGAGALSFGTIDGNALNGTTVEIREGKALPTIYDNVDAVMTDPTFIIGANGELTNYGWYTANGTLTIENAGDTAAFLSGSGIRGVTKIVKKGAGNLTFRSWKATGGNKEAFSCPIEIQAGRLTFFPHGNDYTVSGAITGSGSVGIVQGTAAANSVIINGQNNTYSGGTFVAGGTLKLGFKNALGGQYKNVTVQEGAVLDVNGVIDHGLDATLNGGTIKNSTNKSDGNDSNVQFRTIALTADSYIDIAYNYGILNGGYNPTTMTLNGYTLTKSGNGGLTLCNVTSDAGTLKIVSGPVRAIQRDSNLSQMSLVIAGEDVNFSENRALTFKDVTIENGASLQAGQGSFTVNGTLKVDGSIAKATTIATTGTLDLSAIEGTSSAEKITGNLTINSGVAFKFAAGHTGAAYTLCGGTLTAPESYAGQVTVGEEESFPATLGFDTEAKTVSYATSLTEYALSETDLAAITSANLSYGGVALIDVSAEVTQDIAKEATITGAPDGHVAYGLGSKFIGVIKMNYEEAMEAKLKAAALHFDVSRLNTIAADAQNNVTSLDNLGADSTRAMASLTGNGNSANVSPVMTASNTGIYLDFGAGGTHKDLSWQRLEGIKTVIQVIDLVHDGNKGFFLGDWNSGSGTYGFHRGDSAQYLNTQHCKADYVYDNGVSKDRGADCPTGMRVLSMGETGSDNICSDCFSHDRNQGTRNGGRKLCETVVFTTALSDSERVAIEDYLLRKWFNAVAVVNGTPYSDINAAITAAGENITGIHLTTTPTVIPEGYILKDGCYQEIYAKVDETGFATIEDAVASLDGGAGTVKVVKRATGDLASAPANAAYTLEYTKGMGAENARYYLPFNSAGASVTLSSATEADVYYTKETVSGNATTINMNNAIVNFGDQFSVGQATYNLTGTTQVTAPRLILSQGAAGRTSNLSMSGSAKLTVTGNNCVDSNQSTIMFGHYNGPSTFTISESAQFIAENAWVLVGKTGNDHTINIQGGTFTTKGIKLAGNASQNNTLTISGGELRLGDAGMTKNGGAMTTTVSGNATITATAATMPLELPITVNDNVTLSISGATIKDVNVSNITLGENSVLDLTGCTALEGVNYGTLRDFSSVPTDKIRLPDGACYVVEPVVPAEYANGAAFTLTNVPEDVTVKAKIPGVEALSEMTREGTTLSHDDGIIRISGMATSFDITYTNVNAFAYKSITATANQDSSMTYNNTLNDHTTAANLVHHPFVESMTAFYRNTAQLSFAVVGTMPDTSKTTFIHMGETRTNNDGGYGLLIATGTKKDEVTVSWNHGTTVNLITTISVPNAASERHVYIVTKDDVDTTSTFRVYLDGKLRKELVIDRITIIGGIQVGSDFGGLLKDLPVSNANHYNQATTGLVNLIRGYDRVISQAEIEQYSIESEYPYHPPFGESSREFASDETTANWIEAEDNTSWSVKAKGATEATATYQPIAGSAVTANFAGATTVTVNVSEEGLTYENLEITGTGPATFVKGANSGEIKVSGKVNVYCPIVIKPGSLDISTPPVELFDTGNITFDYSEFDLSSVVKTTKITLIGSIDRADEKVIFTAPATHPYHTLAVNYDTLTGYVLTITPNHQDGDRVYLKTTEILGDDNLAGKVYLDAEGSNATVKFPNDIVVLSVSDITLTADADALAVGKVLSGVEGLSVKKTDGANNTVVYSLIDTSTEPIQPSEDPDPVVIEDVGEGVTLAPNAKVEIALPEGATTEQKSEIAAKITVMYGETVLTDGPNAPVSVSIADDGSVELTTTDAAKPAATEIAMSTPTEGEGEEATDKVQFTITNPIPGLFYEIVSGDSFDEHGVLVVDEEAEKGTSQATTSAEAKTVSIPMTFTDGKKVKYYKVSVKATK